MAEDDVDPEILGKVKEIVVSQLAVEEAQVVPSASFTKELGADSLDTVELIMALEEGFDVSVTGSFLRLFRRARSRMKQSKAIVMPGAEHGSSVG